MDIINIIVLISTILLVKSEFSTKFMSLIVTLLLLDMWIRAPLCHYDKRLLNVEKYRETKLGDLSYFSNFL